MKESKISKIIKIIKTIHIKKSVLPRNLAAIYVVFMCCSATQSYQTLCDPLDCSTPGLPVPHQCPKFAQVHVHCISGAIQPSHPLTPSSPYALNLSQHQGLFQGVGCLHQVTKILELQLQHQSFQWYWKSFNISTCTQFLFMNSIKVDIIF